MRIRGSIQPKVCFALFLGSLSFANVIAEDWPQFRGPDGQGRVAWTDVPTAWSEQKNVRWKTPIPGLGWSSPVIESDQIWLSTATDEGCSLRALCIDRQSGQIETNIEVFRREAAEHVHSQNSHATPTPVIDGDFVFVHFGTNGTACLNREGEIVWRNNELTYATPHGSANSPVVHGDLVILCCDGEDRQFIAALHKSTGEVVWRRDRAHMEDAHRKSQEETNEGRKGLPFIAFSTPLVVDVDGTPLLISTPADHVVANRVDTGEEIWWFPFNCFSLVARPIADRDTVYAIGGMRDGHYVMYAIPLRSRGKLAESDLLWQRAETIPQCPSPIILEDRIFLIKDSGIATCVEAANGKELWQERIGGKYRASPVAVGDQIFVVSEDGKTTILQLKDEFRKSRSNQLDGFFLASPAIAGKSIYLRSHKHLYRIEEQPWSRD